MSLKTWNKKQKFGCLFVLFLGLWFVYGYLTSLGIIGGVRDLDMKGQEAYYIGNTDKFVSFNKKVLTVKDIDGKVYKTIETDSLINSIAVSLDGKWIAYVCEYKQDDQIIMFHVLNSETYEEINFSLPDRENKKIKSGGRRISFSDDNKEVILWEMEGDIEIWNIDTGKLVSENKVIKDNNGKISYLEPQSLKHQDKITKSYDNKYLFLNGVIFDIEKNEKMKRTGNGNGIIYSPSSKYIYDITSRTYIFTVDEYSKIEKNKRVKENVLRSKKESTVNVNIPLLAVYNSETFEKIKEIPLYEGESDSEFLTINKKGDKLYVGVCFAIIEVNISDEKEPKVERETFLGEDFFINSISVSNDDKTLLVSLLGLYDIDLGKLVSIDVSKMKSTIIKIKGNN